MVRVINYVLEDGTVVHSCPSPDVPYTIEVILTARSGHILRNKFTNKRTLAYKGPVGPSNSWEEVPLD